MSNNSENLEKIINEALNLKEEGKTISEILNLYPEYKNELKEIFQTIDILNEEKEKVLPSKELLVKILSELTSSKNVTEKEFSRYLYRSKKEPDFSGYKGRGSIIQLLERTSLMTMKKIYLGIGVLVLALIVIGAYYLTVVTPNSNQQTANQASSSQSPASSLSAAQEAQLLAEATSNPDTIVNNLLDNSQVSSTPVESDPSLTSSSSSDVLDSLNQAVDINNL
jgi:hypothetical protein